jgi:hypothetical protein
MSEFATVDDNDGFPTPFDEAAFDADVLALGALIMTDGATGPWIWEAQSRTNSNNYVDLVVTRTTAVFAEWFVRECPAWQLPVAARNFSRFASGVRLAKLRPVTDDQTDGEELEGEAEHV